MGGKRFIGGPRVVAFVDHVQKFAHLLGENEDSDCHS